MNKMNETKKLFFTLFTFFSFVIAYFYSFIKFYKTEKLYVLAFMQAIIIVYSKCGFMFQQLEKRSVHTVLEMEVYLLSIVVTWN